MTPVQVGIRTVLSGEPHPVTGTAPTESSALAVVPVHIFNNALRTWYRPEGAGWCVTHRPTGLRLPGDWTSEGEALAVIAAAVPGFPGWLLAKGGADCMATTACKAMWRVARSVAA